MKKTRGRYRALSLESTTLGGTRHVEPDERVCVLGRDYQAVKTTSVVILCGVWKKGSGHDSGGSSLGTAASSQTRVHAAYVRCGWSKPRYSRAHVLQERGLEPEYGST